MQALNNVFKALTEYPQFILYKLVSAKKKIPINFRTGIAADPTDHIIHATANEILAALQVYDDSHGIGFVFTEHDPFFFIDIDNCLIDNAWSPIAMQLMDTFAGAAVEISSSGKGLHIIAKGSAPNHSCKNAVLGLELYTSKRFVALTGLNAIGSADVDFTHKLTDVVNAYFNNSKCQISTAKWTDAPCDEWDGETDDDLLITRAIKSKSTRAVFGNKASFADLWEANIEAVKIAFPDNFRDREYDESSADAALAQHLAFWTGKDCERIKRLMLKSKLVRDKWDREDYLYRTILNACARQVDIHKNKLSQSIISNVDAIDRNTGNTFLNVEEQISLFKDCTYVRDAHKVLIRGGILLKPEQFKAHFGGYTHPMDSRNEKVTRNAWEAFTESQAVRFPRVDSICFRPDLDANTIIETEGQRLVNVWSPIITPRFKGNVTPFIDHLKRLYPDEKDQQILLAYFAAIVQHKGIKFQYAPILQGAEGNGKTLFTRCLAHAVGHRYCHFPKASEITAKFNSWIYGKILICVEDIYFKEKQIEVIEALKPIITNNQIEIEFKGMDKVTREICCNFILSTNHKDGLPKTRNDRRFAVFYSVQQSAEDIVRDKMNKNYFIDLYNWLRDKQGYAIVCDYLYSYSIPDEFNPATYCQRAPITSSTDDAITHGFDEIEQEIIEAIEQEQVGFKGGWISSSAIDRLLDNLGLRNRVSYNRRYAIVLNLGYVKHPHLTKGRVNSVILPDGGKPRLYIQKEHEHIKIKDPSWIAKAYTEAQQK